MRDVRGDLEFRNELIRAQAYYAVASAARVQIHRRVAELPSGKRHKARCTKPDPRGRLALLERRCRPSCDPLRASRCRGFSSHRRTSRSRRSIERTIDCGTVNSSTTANSTPFGKGVAGPVQGRGSQTYHQRPSGMPGDVTSRGSRNIDAESVGGVLAEQRTGEKYCEVAKKALECAARTEDPHLISRALIECAVQARSKV